MLFLFLVAVVLLQPEIFIAQASPTRELRRLDLMPRDATFLAADSGAGIIYAFNDHGDILGMLRNSTFSSLIPRAGGCTAMDAKTAQSSEYLSYNRHDVH